MPTTALVALLCALAPGPAPTTALDRTRSERERGAIHDRVVLARLDQLLPAAMRSSGVGMWIVLTREDAVDPVFRFITPDGAYPGSRNAWVFVDTGAARVRRVVVGSHPEKQAAPFFDEVIEASGDGVFTALRALADRHAPKAIAVDVAADTAAADGLSASMRDGLLAGLGPHAAAVVSAERLVIDLLEPRLPEERAHFEEAARVTRGLWEEAFSRRVITPGQTTVGDLLWHVRQRMADLHVGTWFRPDLRVQRRGVPFEPMMVAPDDQVILPGDLLHLDVGITYLDLSTDYQRMAYVPAPGETAPPPGLVKALAATNRLQELLVAEMREGRPGAEVHAAAMARAQAEGLQAMIYSHSVGLFGHFVGAAIGAYKPGSKPSLRASLPLRAGAFTSIELNTRSPVPEWGGQQVYVMLEDDAWLSPEGMRFFLPRQTSLMVVR
jgi:hypothetical protein